MWQKTFGCYLSTHSSCVDSPMISNAPVSHIIANEQHGLFKCASTPYKL